jgi:hypothetical protein
MGCAASYQILISMHKFTIGGIEYQSDSNQILDPLLISFIVATRNEEQIRDLILIRLN